MTNNQMNRFPLLVLLVLALVFGRSGRVIANTTTIADTTFNVSDWSSFSVIPAPGEAPAIINFNQVASGGNTGSYMQLNISQTSTDIGGGSDIFGGIQSAVLTWNPSTQGAITSLDISVDWKGLSIDGSSYLNLFFIQNGLVFVAPNNFTFVGGETEWTSYSGSTIYPGDLYRGFHLDGTYEASFLDFSQSGGVISFGLGSCEARSAAITNSIGIDNFSVSVTTSAVPEPSTYALFGLGALVLVMAARRKVSQV